MHLIRELNRRDGTTILMITHDLTVPFDDADKILSVGEPLFFGTKEAFLATPGGKRVATLRGGEGA